MQCIQPTVLAVFLAATLAMRPGAAQEEAPPRIDARIYEEGALLRIARPQGAQGRWVLLDDRGALKRQGVYRPGEEALYVGDLSPGAYFLFSNLSEDRTPNIDSGPQGRAAFLVVAPIEQPLPEDHYLVVNQPLMLRPLSEGEEPGLSDREAFVLDAMQRLGIRRLRCSFALDRVRRGAEAWDFRQIEALLREAENRAVKFIAVLGRSNGTADMPRPNADEFEDFDRLNELAAQDASYVEDLLRRFGFRLDVFALWPQPNTLSFPAPAHRLVTRVGPTYRVLKERSPYCSVSLGGLAAQPNDPAALSRADFVADVLTKARGLFDVLDAQAEGSLREAMAFRQVLDEAVDKVAESIRQSTPDEAEGDRAAAMMRDIPRAVSIGACSAGPDTIAAQRRQAVELVKKVVLFRHRRYHYFGVGPILETDSPGASGIDTREAQTGARALFAGPDAWPRIAAGALHQALRRIAGARVVDSLRYSDEKVRICGFENRDVTILAAWAPLRPDDAREDKRMVVELFWPDDIQGRVYDMMGRDLTDRHLKNIDEAARIKRLFLVDVEPLWLVVPTPASSVRW